MKIDTLRNGIRYCVDKNNGSSSVSVYFMVNVGSINEKKDEEGMAHFLEHMLFKGTKKRLKSKNVSNNIYKLGGETNAFTSYDVTGYYINVGADYVENVVEILSDMLFNSTFKDWRDERGVVISENKKNSSIPQAKFNLKYNQNIYKGTPYEHDIGGTNSVIKTFNLKKTKSFYNRYYVPENIVVSVAGKVPKNIDKIIAKYFGGKLRGSNSKTPEYKPIENFMEKQKKPRFFSMVDNVDQAEVIVGFPCFNYNERKTHVLKIISIVLAGNMSSRLFVKLREKMGLVYTVRSNIDANIDCGDFSISFGTFLNKVNAATKVVIDELVDVRENGITEEELKNSVNYICGMMDLSKDDNEDRAVWNGFNILKLGKILTTSGQKKIYRSIKMKEIRDVAKEVIRYDKLNHAVLSNKKHRCTIRGLKKI
jgi:predicted Zn-dependent peptidase